MGNPREDGKDKSKEGIRTRSGRAPSAMVRSLDYFISSVGSTEKCLLGNGTI